MEIGRTNRANNTMETKHTTEPEGKDGQSKRIKEDLNILRVRNAEEIAKDREERKQYAVAEMGLKGL